MSTLILERVELARHGRVLGVAFFGAVIGPGGEGRDLIGGKGAVVGEFAVLGVGKPGRHLAKHDGLLDGASPGAGLLIGEERHAADLARAVTLLAAGLEDREDVFVERGFVGGKDG